MLQQAFNIQMTSMYKDTTYIQDIMMTDGNNVEKLKDMINEGLDKNQVD